MTREVKLNFVFMAFILILSTIYFLEVVQHHHIEHKITVIFVYILLCISIVWAAAKDLIAMVRAKKEHQFKSEEERSDSEVEQPLPFLEQLKVFIKDKKVLFYFLLLVYVITITRLGFYTTSTVFLVLGMLLLEVRKISTLVLVPVVVMGMTYLLFYVLLDVRLPGGILF